MIQNPTLLSRSALSCRLGLKFVGLTFHIWLVVLVLVSLVVLVDTGKYSTTVLVTRLVVNTTVDKVFWVPEVTKSITYPSIR